MKRTNLPATEPPRSVTVTLLTSALLAVAAFGQASTTWTGNAGTAWDSDANWTSGKPTALKAAIIPAVSANTPEVGGASPVCRALSIAGGAQLNVPLGQVLDVGGSISASGTGAATVVGAGTLRITSFGAIAGSATATLALPNLVIQAPASASVSFGGQVSIAGNLTLNSGRLCLVNNSTTLISVAGNASFLGGTMPFMSLGQAGVLDVEGNVTFAGCAATPTHVIRCAGNWTADDNAAPSTVELDGSAPSALTATGPTSTLSFTLLEIKNGARAPSVSLKVRSNSTVIRQGGELSTGARSLDLQPVTGTLNVLVYGTLRVVAGGDLGLGPNNACYVQILSGGMLSVIGSPLAPAVVRGTLGGGYSLSIAGTMEASNFEFREMNSAGVVLQAGMILAPAPHDLRHGRFDFRAGATPGSRLLDTRLGYPVTISYVTFDNSQSVSSPVNIRSPTGGNVDVYASGGVLGGPGGELFDDDPANRVHWIAPNPTTVASFTATGGPALVTLGWTSSVETDIEKYVLLRASANNPLSYSQVAEVAPTGPGNYAYTDVGLSVGQTFLYRLTERLTHQVSNQLGTASAQTTSGAPVIVTQPAGVTACVGSSVTLSVLASGNPPFSYQWRRGAVPVGVNAPTHVITSVSTTDGGTYSVDVTNAFGSATSASATLTVRTNPTITSHPASQSVCAGASVTLAVAATGSNLRYQWFKDGRRIQSATASTWPITGATSSDAGAYTCLVGNNCNILTAGPATLTLNTPLVVTAGSPTAITACPGSQMTFQVSASGGGPYGYEWYRNGTISLGVHQSSLTIPAPPLPGPGSDTYHCVVSNACNSASSPVFQYTVSGAPLSITAQPSAQSGAVGAPTVFSVTATGTPAPTYQWRRNGIAIPGSTGSTLSISRVDWGDAGFYDVVVSNPCGSLTSNPAQLTIAGTPVITAHPKSQVLCLGQPVTLAAQVSGNVNLVEWFKDGAPIPNPAGLLSLSLTIAAATAADAGTYRVEVTGGGATAASYDAKVVAPSTHATATAPRDVVAADLSSPPDGRLDLAVASAAQNAVAIHWSTTPISGSDPFTTPAVTVNLQPGDEPSVLVHGNFDASGGVDLAVACRGSNRVVFLPNVGAPTSAPQVAWLLPPTGLPSGLAAGRLTPSAATDLLVAMDGGILGQGNLVWFHAMSFAPVGSFLAPVGGFGSIRAVAIGDLDGDGDMDVAASMAPSIFHAPGTGGILLYENYGLAGSGGNGNAQVSFSGPQLLPTVQNPRGLVLTDLDGDGRLDITVTFESSGILIPGGMRVYLHDSSAGMAPSNFTASSNVASGVLPSKVVAGDLRDDSVSGFLAHQDLVTVNAGSGNLTLHEDFQGSGFVASRLCTAGTNPSGVALGDFDGNHTTDMAIVSTSSSSLTVYVMPPDPLAQVFGANCPGATGLNPVISLVRPPFVSAGIVGLRIDGALALSTSTLKAANALQVTQSPGTCPFYLGLNPATVASVTTDGIGRAIFPINPAAFGGPAGTVLFQILDTGVLSGSQTSVQTAGLRVRFGP